MHENNFEKQVREKMDQLGFDPTDTVWANVDKEINKDKKHRRPVFWLLFFTVLLLAGGGYYFAKNKKAVSPIVTANQQKETVSDRRSQEERKQNNQEINKAGIKIKEIKKENEEKAIQKQYSALSGKTQGHKTRFKTINHYSQNIKAVLDGKYDKEFRVVNSGRAEIKPEEPTGLEKGENKKPEKYAAADNSETGLAEGNIQNNRLNEVGDVKINPADSSAVDKINTVAENKASRKDSVADSKTAKTIIRKRKSSSWKIGFTGGTGFSNINQSLFKPASLTNSAYYAAPGPGSLNAGPGPIYASSKITPGYSFGAGAFVSRYLSERASISTGINYHYFSTKMQIGILVNSSLPLYSLSGSISYINSFYQNSKDRTYTNQYHFIELPLSINIQLNESRQVPVVWEGGFSLAYLIGSNALHFDPLTNVYYKNNQLFNKTQLNAATAVMIGITFHHSAIQLGPQLQYGLTSLLKAGAGNPQHVLYYGLKISFVPGEK